MSGKRYKEEFKIAAVKEVTDRRNLPRASQTGLPPPRRTLSIGMMSLSEVLHGT